MRREKFWFSSIHISKLMLIGFHLCWVCSSSFNFYQKLIEFILEPIALNPRTCTTPIIDQYSWLTWEYEVHHKYGIRGLFAWDFDYRSSRQRRDQVTNPKPTPIMLGCAFAINRQYFWDLGAYDDQLLIWNAENYELS